MFPATMNEPDAQTFLKAQKRTAHQTATQIVILADGEIDVICDTANEAARHVKELKRQDFAVQSYTMDRMCVDMFCDLVQNGMGASKAYRAAVQEVGQ